MTLWLLLGNWTGREGGVQAGALCQAPKSLWRTCAQLCAGTRPGSLEVQPLLSDDLWGKGSITSGFSALSTSASLTSLAGEGHGGGATHAWEDAPLSTSAPVSFSSAGRPILLSGNDHPQMAGPSSRADGRRGLLPGLQYPLGGRAQVDPGFPAPWAVGLPLATN